MRLLPLPIRPLRARRTGDVGFAKRRARHALRLLVAGYEVLAPARWGAGVLPGGAAGILGRPGPPYSEGTLLTRETFLCWRERDWIRRAKPHVRSRWQVWRITGAGRKAAA